MLQFYEPDLDYGTPVRFSKAQVELTIDGVKVSVSEGTSVMRAAVEAGIDIPKLCASDSLEPFGSCRICLVEIEGRKGFPASCTTPVEPGMEVSTQSGPVKGLRHNVMELYMSDHPQDCVLCATGECELQDIATQVGVESVRYGFEGTSHLESEKDCSNPYFTFDPSSCIVCSRAFTLSGLSSRCFVSQRIMALTRSEACLQISKATYPPIESPPRMNSPSTSSNTNSAILEMES